MEKHQAEGGDRGKVVRVIRTAAQRNGVPFQDRPLLRAMADDWVTNGGHGFGRMLAELTDDGLEVLRTALAEVYPWQSAPSAHAPAFDALAGIPHLSEADQQACRGLADDLRAGRIDLDEAFAGLPDDALARFRESNV